MRVFYFMRNFPIRMEQFNPHLIRLKGFEIFEWNVIYIYTLYYIRIELPLPWNAITVNDRKRLTTF